MSSEFGFLRDLKQRYGLSQVGDDCAVLPSDKHSDLVVTADMLIEDIDFRLSWATPSDIGHKALAVSLSDVAAMGATPVWSTVSIGLPEAVWRSDFVDHFYQGYMQLAKLSGVELVGGDISKSPDKIVIDSVVGGSVRHGMAIMRSGAKAGDVLLVSGTLGGAAGGLRLLEDHALRLRVNNDEVAERLIEKQLRPSPATKEAEFLSSNELATSMIDVSDGLSGDVAHLAAASGVGFRIYASKIPVDPDLKSIFNEPESLQFALGGGEDYRLLLTVSSEKFSRHREDFESRGFCILGEATLNAANTVVMDDGDDRILEPNGFRHF